MALSIKRGVQHLLHCIAFIAIIFVWIYVGTGLSSIDDSILNPWESYGWIQTVSLYICRSLVLLSLPVALFNFLGLVLFPAFPDKKITVKKFANEIPFICFRVVTRGDYPQLVRENTLRNVQICREAGLTNFIVEVVTDRSISLDANKRTREVVVPPYYQTRSGAMFKARALQYCLEDGVSDLDDDDWIVHLDEETILSDGSVKGITNFVCDGRHQFGQGVITYANEKIVNLLLTLFDTMRVGDDVGKIRFQFKITQMPLMGWKGSYVVSQARAEKEVSFDNGPESSIAEDAYFGLLAASKGFTFGFIEGEMWEKSPFTILDFLRQRKRWIQGLLLVTHSANIPIGYRILFGSYVYATASMPLTICNLFLQPCFPVPICKFVNLSGCFTVAVMFYLNIYGTIRSFSFEKIGWLKLIFLVFLVIVTIPIKVILELIAIMWAWITPKNEFVIIDKNICTVIETV